MRIAPDRGLLLLATLVVAPSLAVGLWGGTLSGVAWSVLLFAILLVTGDLLFSRRRLDALDLDTKPLLRATLGREVSIDLDFDNSGGELFWLRAGLELPDDLGVRSTPIGDSDGRVAARERLRLRIDVTPLRRGQFRIPACHVETTSWCHLWLIRRRIEIDVELRVYPDLRHERRRLSALFLHRGGDGLRAVRQMGKGREFEQLREYLAGDDYGDVDWKATSRRGLPITRTYQIERTQEVYVVVDHSRLSGREIRQPMTGSGSEGRNGEFWNAAPRENRGGDESMVTTQLEAFLKCALVLASVARQQGDLFGLVGFSNRVDRFVRSRGGAQHYNVVRDALYTMESAPVAPDFEELMVTLRQRLTRRALLILLVDLSDPLTAESFYETVPLIARQHLVLVNMVKPEFAHPLFSAHDQPGEVDDVYRHLAGHLQWRELRETANKLGHLGVDLSFPDHAELTVDAVSQYLKVKSRQLL